MARKRSRARDLAEYLSARLMLAVARVLPARALRPMARWCG